MDNRPFQTDNVEDKAQKLSANDKEIGSLQSSRFSRRRFMQSGIAASPLLMSIKSPVAWGVNLTNSSVAVSGNQSNTSSVTTLSSMDPTQCSHVINDHRSVINRALGVFGVNSKTHALRLFCKNLTHWNQGGEGSKYKISLTHSHQPTVNQALNHDAYSIKLIVRCEDKQPKKNRYHNSHSQIIDLSVNISESSLIKYLTCAYINGILKYHSDEYEYEYEYNFTHLEIIEAFETNIQKIANEVASKARYSIKQPSLNVSCPELRNALQATWNSGSYS